MGFWPLLFFWIYNSRDHLHKIHDWCQRWSVWNEQVGVCCEYSKNQQSAIPGHSITSVYADPTLLLLLLYVLHITHDCKGILSRIIISHYAPKCTLNVAKSLNQIQSNCHQESGILQGITPKWTPPSTLSFDRCKLWNIWTWPLGKTFQRLLKALFKLHLNNLIRILRVDFIMWLQGDKPDPLLGSVEVRPSTSTLPPRLRPRSKNCPGNSIIPREMWFGT